MIRYLIAFLVGSWVGFWAGMFFGSLFRIASRGDDLVGKLTALKQKMEDVPCPKKIMLD